MANDTEEKKKPVADDDDDGILDLRALAATSVAPAAPEPEKKDAASDDGKLDIKALTSVPPPAIEKQEPAQAKPEEKAPEKAAASAKAPEKAAATPAAKTQKKAGGTKRAEADAKPVVAPAAAQKSSNSGLLIGIGLAALLVVGGFAYMKMGAGDGDSGDQLANGDDGNAVNDDTSSHVGAAPNNDSVAPPNNDSVAPPNNDSVAPPTNDSVAPPTNDTVAPPTNDTATNDTAPAGTDTLQGTQVGDVPGTAAVDTVGETAPPAGGHARPRAGGGHGGAAHAATGGDTQAATPPAGADTHATPPAGADTHATPPAGADTHATPAGHDTHATPPPAGGAGHGNLDSLLDNALGGHPPPTHTEPAQNTHTAPAAGGPLPETPASADIARTMGRLLGQVRQCAGDQVGLATASVMVKNDGSVGSVTIAGSPFGGTPQGACMEGVVRRATFPPFHQTTFRFNYPYSIRAM